MKKITQITIFRDSNKTSYKESKTVAPFEWIKEAWKRYPDVKVIIDNKNTFILNWFNVTFIYNYFNEDVNPTSIENIKIDL